MPSVVEICSMALGHLKVPPIASVDERSEPARACNLYYAQARDEVLRAYPWPFATRFADLALVQEAPTVEWGYSYRYPTDCAHFRRILSGAGRNETRAMRVPFRLARDADGRLIFTDQPTAVAEYTAQVEDPNEYDADFVGAVALRFAVYVAPRVTQGDQLRLGDRAQRLYLEAIGEARSTAANEEQPDAPPDGELLASRE